MKCELCSSGQREHGRRLCLSCMEAVARLWNIASNATVSQARQDEKVQAAARTKYVPIVALPPNISLL
jgi:hypothetical protein